jgi:hypothetical protein
MPAPDSQDERRDERLTNGLFWGGVGIAPLAALLLLVGRSGGPLRIAAVLAILAVVMIGLSITLRGNSDALRVELEEILYEEIDALRKDVREDIGTAARATHKSFGEKLQVLYEQLNTVRAQLDAIRAEAGRAEAAPAVRHTETVQVTTRETIEDAGWSGQRSRRDARRSRAYDRDEEQPRYEAAPRYADRYPEPRYEDSRYEAPPYEPPRHEPLHEHRHEPRPRHGAPAPADRWSGVRAGDRWGSIREDDRGREVRMGERRAAVHADDTGTELRYEDRWAAMRSDEPRPPDPTWGRRAIAALPAGGQPTPPLWDAEPDREPAPRRRRDSDRGDDHRDTDAGYRYRRDTDDRWRR